MSKRRKRRIEREIRESDIYKKLEREYAELQSKYRKIRFEHCVSCSVYYEGCLVCDDMVCNLMYVFLHAL